MKQHKLNYNMGTKKHKAMIIILALIAVYLFWGGTYLGMKFAIETIPPFIMAGIRFTLAGGILYIIFRIKGGQRPSLVEWKNPCLVGAMLLLGGNGVVAWAEQQVPSSIASVLIATVPLWIITFSCVGERKKPSIGSIIGIILGLCGISILVWNSNGTSSHATNVFGMVAIIFAAFSWSAGSMYSRKAKMPSSPLLSTGLQMISGGILLLIAAAFHGDYSGFEPTKISLNSWIAMGYLVIFGSLIAFSAYIWLLNNIEPSIVSTHAFVNPIVAVFLGWLFAGEIIEVNALIAAVLIILAVVVITVFRDKKNSKNSAVMETKSVNGELLPESIAISKE